MTKLILHFDINGTITPFDTTDTGTKEENANVILAKSVYGKVIDNNWVLNDDVNDQTDSVTYYHYLRKTHKIDYKNFAFVFTNSGEPGESIKALVNIIVDSIDKFLFDSFLKVIEQFPQALIVFRTFGLDADGVIKYLKTNEKTAKKFNNIIVGSFVHTGYEHALVLENGVTIYGMEEINNFLKTVESHLALKENFNYWNENGRNKVYGKQVMGDTDMVQMFFDDNDCVNVIESTNVRNIKINTLQAMMDNQYFCDKICEVR